MKTKNLVLCAVFAALSCALAPLSVPIASLVPISLSTFSVMLSGVLLGGRLSMISQAVYLLLGALGLPVFAGYTAGLGHLLGPTGGYLIGYLPLAFLCGALYANFGKYQTGAKKYLALVFSMLAGTAVLYLFGTAWFCIVTHTGVLAALMSCVVPFLFGDLVKIFAVALLTPSLEKALAKIPAPARENPRVEKHENGK